MIEECVASTSFAALHKTVTFHEVAVASCPIVPILPGGYPTQGCRCTHPVPWLSHDLLNVSIPPLLVHSNVLPRLFRCIFSEIRPD